MEPARLTLQSLEEITDGFSEERCLGEGAYGKVYRGVCPDGKEIAVKVLYDASPEHDDKKFQNEFRNLMMLQHENIIQFVGYCYETRHKPLERLGKNNFDKTYRALCFEYMQNGSLQMHLSDETEGLGWHTRYKIIKGTCQGLKYLHEGLEEAIYHLDLKPANILLDKNMVPKLADFGLSKIFGEEQTRLTHSCIGTPGYLPVEYIEGNMVSNKLDVYSLGVVMIKIISGPWGRIKSSEMPLQKFVDLVEANWKKRLELSFTGPSLEAQCQQVKKCIAIAFRCVEKNRHKRPSIGKIILMLNETESETVKTTTHLPLIELPIKTLSPLVSSMRSKNITGDSLSRCKSQDVREIIGFDIQVGKLVNLLTDGLGKQKQKLMVVPIVGPRGIGKTTFARLVYRRLMRQFECRAFTSLSLKPNMKMILSDILQQISEGSCNASKNDLDELKRTVKNFLVQKRYFIVIDDVWSEEAWKTMVDALTDNNLGSRVIVTTRNRNVANLSSVGETVFELNPLSYEDSKRLLFKRVFNEEEGSHSELEDVTKKILKKCGGIPLAIINIARVLANIPNKREDEWYGVYKSMGFGLEKYKNLENTEEINKMKLQWHGVYRAINLGVENDMAEILHLSYSDLPSYLKPCLLYLSMFPEDYVIPKMDLIHLWLAEGFVEKGSGSNVYELGERYFNELVNRSMIQPVHMDKVGNPRACAVHDIVLEFIGTLSEQENFVTISHGMHPVSPVFKIRRLSLQGNEVASKGGSNFQQEILQATTDMSHVRSLAAFGDAFGWISRLSKFSVLRVLYSPSESNITVDLGTLRHLRYLKLGGLLETKLLEEIGNLQCLQTLNLSAAFISELPAGIIKLKQLENLLIGSVKLPHGMGNLMSLQLLSVLDLEKSPHTLAELGSLTRLRTLYVYGLDFNESYETFIKGLCNLHDLRTLILESNGLCSLDCIPDRWCSPVHLQRFEGRRLTFSLVPQWFASLSKLSCLSIKVQVLKQTHLQLLGALPVLRFLRVIVHWDGDGITHERLVIGTDEPFFSLVEFNFQHYNRCWLVFTEGVMPKLQRLGLYFNVQKRNGGGFDLGLENLTSLRQVNVKCDCEGARLWEVEDAEAKVRDAVAMHPDHPTLELSRINAYSMAEEEENYGMFGL